VLISLIVTTRQGRTLEISRLFESLRESSDQSFEVILVTQDCAAAVTPIINEYQGVFVIRHLQRESCSVSAARETALQHCSGEIIGFPDDDCWYAEDTLGKISAYFQKTPNIAFVCALVMDPIRRFPFGHRRTSRGSVPINVSNAFRLPVSVGTFVDARQAKELLHFDQRFGAGAKWGSGEETDLILSLLRSGLRGVFTPDVVVYHEINYEGTDPGSIEKAFRYARGFGALTAKSICLRKQYGMCWVYIDALARTCARAALSGVGLNLGNCKLNIARVSGMLRGFMEGIRLYGP
jgi:glycosyltransferase involved in cell wall biosynthesis